MNEFLKELQDSARQVMEGAGTPAKEESTWPLVVELGWLLAAVPEELEGLGLGVEAACMLHQELGRNLAEVPFLPATLVVDALCQSSLADKADWVARFTQGESATAPLKDPEITADWQGDAVSLSGKISAVQSLDKCSHLLVWDNSASIVALLPTTTLASEARNSWDTTRRFFEVTLDTVAVVPEAILAQGAEAKLLVERLLNLRDFALAADSLGGAAGLLEITLEHLKTRQQFGRPLAVFQALKHRCADLKTEIAAAEALLNSTLAASADDLGSATAMANGKKAKYLASATYAWVAEESLQLHGGIGMASEYPCHLYLKRSMMTDYLGSGTGEYQIDIANDFLQSVGS